MGEPLLRIVSSVVCACVFFVATLKMQGVLQQGAYRSRALLKWLKKRGNLYGETLSIWSGLTLLFCSLVVACFFFLGRQTALALSAIPFLFFAIFFAYVDSKRALKVPLKITPRVRRLSVCYFVILLLASYAAIALLAFLSALINVAWVGFVCYLPFCFFPLFTPYLLSLANTIDGVYERKKNAKFVLSAAEKLKQEKVIKIAVVGSYGKTSVKNILRDILSEKYAAIATPESYNTPLGVAKTVFSPDFSEKEVFIVEMGARQKGDIRELCEMVQPDFAVLTGVCAQHIETFGSFENVLLEKTEILKSTAKKIVCAGDLKETIETAAWLTDEEKKKCVFVDTERLVSTVEYAAEETAFTLSLGGETVGVKTTILGESAVQNIALAASVAVELGLEPSRLNSAISRVRPIPHRLELSQANGVYILDDSYNANEKGARVAIGALERFEGRKIIVTPGIVETGVLDEKINGEFGAALAISKLDDIVLVGETLVKSVKDGYLAAGGNGEKITQVPTLKKAQEWLSKELKSGDAVLFLNDLPDLY